MACYLLSLVHHYYQKNGPGTIKPCPWSIFLMINMSHGLLFIVPGPSLLPKEWPRDNQTMSQVHISDNQYVPWPIIYCPWSIIITKKMAQGQSNHVPGPYF